jgi:hypothetical protein
VESPLGQGILPPSRTPRLATAERPGQCGKAGQRARISVPVHGNHPLKLRLQRHLLKLAGIDQDEAAR